MPPRESWFGRLIRHFHEHPRGRLHEFAFWAGLGLAMGGGAFFAWRAGKLSDPLALMLAIVAACFVGWALLPRARQRPPPPLPKGKRGTIAAQVKASKAEKKRKKGGVPPPQDPIRRG